MNDCAIPAAAQDPKLKQGMLDSAIRREPHMLIFTTKGMLDFVVELIVTEDNVCTLIQLLCSGS
jgi:hypothetical protein